MPLPACPTFPLLRPPGPRLAYIPTDDRSIGEKGAYLKAQGLGGVIMWEINEGYISTAPVGQRNPLLTSIGSIGCSDAVRT